MCRGVIRALATLAFVMSAVVAGVGAAAPASAEDPPRGGGGELGGNDQYADGGLLDDGSGAEVVAMDGRDLGEPTAGRRGGGNVVCRFYDDATGEPVNPWNLPPELNGLTVMILRDCEDADTGEYVSIDLIFIVPPLVPQMDARDLALMARQRLPFPLPDIAFSPPLEDPDDFLLVQLESWIWATNWAEVSRTASAGGVVATVTARPVRLTWDFTPRRSDPETEGGCAGPGTPYDPSKRPEEQSTDCSITFRHSSAGEPGAAYEGHLTVIYEVSWTSNVGAGGSLGTVPRTTVLPVRVGEQQALNESGGTNQ